MAFWGAFSPLEVTAFENLGERGGDMVVEGWERVKICVDDD